MCLSHHTVSLLLALALGAFARKPLFSWNTVPVYQQLCTVNGTIEEPFSPARLQWLASSYPIVIIEHCQGQGPQAYGHVGPEPYAPAHGYIETHQRAAAAAIKKINASVFVLNYQNIHATLPYFQFVRPIASDAHPEYRLEGCFSTGGHMFPDLKTYEWDITNPAVIDLWKQQFVNMTSEDSPLDGTFVDTASCQKNPHPPGGESQDPRALLNAVQAANSAKTLGYNTNSADYAIGLNQVYSFGNGPAEKWLNYLNDTHVAGMIALAHAQTYAPTTALKRALVIFLLGAQEYSYFAFSDVQTGQGPAFCDPLSEGPPVKPTWCAGMGWIEDFSRPLGKPLGPAKRTNDQYTRSFESGTTVLLNDKKNKCEIKWSDGNITTC